MSDLLIDALSYIDKEVDTGKTFWNNLESFDVDLGQFCVDFGQFCVDFGCYFGHILMLFSLVSSPRR